MGSYTYWLILAGSLAVPFAFSFENRIAFYRKWSFYLPGIFLMATFFIIWDSYFTRFGVWSFSPLYTTGHTLFGLPLEEISFFIIIPYCCIFIHESLIYYFPVDRLKPFEKPISISVVVICVLISLFNPDRAYTFYTAFFCSLFMLILLYLKVNFLSRFYQTYLVSLLPFFIVNGILTALPVVIYNDNENLGIRLYTIPVEDSLYAFLMILMSISGAEFFRSRLSSSATSKG